MAAVLDLAALAQGHKAVAGAAFPVAGGTEAGDVVHLHEPAYDLIQSTGVDNVELLRTLVFRFGFAVAAHAGAGAAADLRDAKMEDALPHLLAFPGRNDHAGVRYGDPDTGNDLGKGIIVNAVGKCTGVNVVCIAEPGHADGVRAYAKRSLQMLSVHEKSGKFIAVFVQTKENA